MLILGRYADLDITRKTQSSWRDERDVSSNEEGPNVFATRGARVASFRPEGPHNLFPENHRGKARRRLPSL